MSGGLRETPADQLDAPPSPNETQVRDGLALFVEEVRTRFGPRLRGVYLFGSRARGDHNVYSDADVAVVLGDGDWSAVAESIQLANETYEILLDFQLDIQPRVIPESHWRDPDLDPEAWLVRKIVADARRLDVAS